MNKVKYTDGLSFCTLSFFNTQTLYIFKIRNYVFISLQQKEKTAMSQGRVSVVQSEVSEHTKCSLTLSKLYFISLFFYLRLFIF